ncbi:retrovirus-related pol polyprotein from transposon TNT 1-94 [Tanacetum coccineum]|uniref:Retrovirus-related pol polyprotein from transposon TNT 1-94 n=1 Tax=Tanacetum coccineum TaxID=301880 RepID=A0ABQ4X9M2_9ASTR
MTSVGKNSITVSQPHAIPKKDVNSDSNGLSFTGVDNTAKTRRPQPRSNTKNDRVPSASKSSCSKNKEVEVEEHPRNLLLSKNKKHMSSECNHVKLAIRNDKSEVVCAMCKQCLITANHDVCVLNYVNDMNSRGKKHKANVSNTENQKKQKPKVMKPKKVGSNERLASPKPSKPRSCLRWSPTGRLFDLKGKIIASSESESQSDCSNGDNACTSNPPEPIIKRFPNSTSFLGRNLKLLINFVWKFLGTVRFGNDHVAAILGFGDLQWGNILITRVYFVEGLGHNMFSVGQFCDSDLEVAFRRNTCFVRNLEGVDLLKGNRTTNLYTIILHEMAYASPICLMARATSTKSWLWHQHLSHLNFDTINDLAKNDLVTDPKGGKITGKGKIKTANLDFDDVYFVDELNFKLLDESQVVLRAPRKDDMYSLDLKNIGNNNVLHDNTALYNNTAPHDNTVLHDNNTLHNNIVPHDNIVLHDNNILYDNTVLHENNVLHDNCPFVSFYIHPFIPSDYDVEDAFSSTNAPNYIPTPPSYSPVTPGNINPDSSNDLTKDLLSSLSILPFHDDPYMKGNNTVIHDNTALHNNTVLHDNNVLHDNTVLHDNNVIEQLMAWSGMDLKMAKTIMSSYTHPSIPSDYDVEDAFSSTNAPNYIPTPSSYSSVTPGNISPDSSHDLTKDLLSSLSILPFHDDPYMKVIQSYDAIPPSQVIIALPAVLPSFLVLSLSPMFDSRDSFPSEKISSPKDTKTPISSSSLVGSSSPVRSTTPPQDYFFDKSIFAKLDNLLWIRRRPLGSKPVLEKPDESNTCYNVHL